MHYVIVSGGFDPLHIGHVELFNDAAQLGEVIVCLNSDEWLSRKKGKPFMPFLERAEIIRNLTSVSRVIAFDDSDGTACDGIKHVAESILPYEATAMIYFANGGDRTDDNTPEQELCDKLGVETIWGIGGAKTQSSSDLLRDFGKLSLKYEQRPWGEFEVLHKEEGYQVKRLMISPGESISLQYHRHRSEHWIFVSGEGWLTVGGQVGDTFPESSVTIPVETLHKIENKGTTPLVIIETQMGAYLEEDDIVRVEDPYNR